jgi:hypothetical protein
MTRITGSVRLPNRATRARLSHRTQSVCFRITNTGVRGDRATENRNTPAPNARAALWNTRGVRSMRALCDTPFRVSRHARRRVRSRHGGERTGRDRHGDSSAVPPGTCSSSVAYLHIESEWHDTSAWCNTPRNFRNRNPEASASVSGEDNQRADDF